MRVLAGHRLALAALLLGALAVLAYDRVLATYRYPYSGDSASYIDMAAALLREGRPLVTPWDVDPGDRDAVPQPLFPPGFSVLIAALTPLFGATPTSCPTGSGCRRPWSTTCCKCRLSSPITSSTPMPSRHSAELRSRVSSHCPLVIGSRWPDQARPRAT